MRDKEDLKKLLAMDIETLDSIAPKPFKPSTISVIVSILAPDYYSQQQKAEINNFYEQCVDAVATAEAEDRMVVSAKRSPRSRNKKDDLAEQEEERVTNNVRRVTKKPTSKNIDKVVAGKRYRESGEEGVAVKNKVSKKPRKNAPSSPSLRYILEPSTLNLSPDIPALAPSPPNNLPSSSSSSSSSSKASPQDLPMEFRSKIMELNGTDIVFVMRKKIFPTDLQRNNDRLSMPISQVDGDFLTKEEKVEIERRDAKENLLGIEVTVFDPCLSEFNLKLKKWEMKSSSHYNLASHWNEVVQTNKLKKGNQLDIWSFRVQDKRYFMLHKLSHNQN